MNQQPKLLVNLPPTFFTHPSLKDEYIRLNELADVRYRSHNSPEEIEEDLTWADSVIMWSWPLFSGELLDKVGGLEFVGQINSGRQTVENCLSRGIPLSEARHAWSPAVAEMALGLVLNGLRRISDFHAAMRESREEWVVQFPEDIDVQERELAGAQVGIIGFGGIGTRFAELLAPFRTTLRVYDPFVSESAMEEFGAKKTGLSEVLSQSEVIVTCAANSRENEGMIGAVELNLIQSGAVVVNVSRSMLFETEALLARARKGDIALLLDVFDQEPLEKDSPFRKLKNVYCTPHRAGGIIPSVQRAIHALIADYEACLKGKDMEMKVTEDMLVCFSE